jgi:hypothetical protein
VYEWSKVATVIEDFFKAAKRWIDHRGTMLIRSSSKVSVGECEPRFSNKWPTNESLISNDHISAWLFAPP